MGIGEKIEALEAFHPDRVASRILGMGDIVTLVEEAERKIDKAQAILQCLHSGLAVHYTQASALHAIPFQHITLGQRENTAPQVHTIPIKRNTQFHITTSLDKITIEEFAKNSPALPAKQQTDWLANKIRETKDAPAMLLSFGF